MNYKAEVIADDSGKWCGNALVFATHAEAESYGRDLMGRWLLVRQTRVVETDAPVNYTFVNGTLSLVSETDGDTF